MSGQSMGTLGFMAPELHSNSQNADHRADIYSLGCSLFYLLTGEPPLPGETAVASHRLDVPPALDAILAKMLALPASERHQTANEVAEALEPFCEAVPAPPAVALLSVTRKAQVGELEEHLLAQLPSGKLGQKLPPNTQVALARPQPKFAPGSSPWPCTVEHPLIAFFDNMGPFALGLGILLMVLCWDSPWLTVSAKAVLGLLAFLLFAAGVSRDFARHFPTFLRFEVFYDDEAIAKVLAQFTQADLQELRLRTDWPAAKTRYFRKLEDTVTKLWGVRFRFTGTTGTVYSSGRTEFVGKRYGWFQKYRIERAEGLIEHTFQLPGDAPKKIYSQFILKNTPANQFAASLKDVLRGTKIIRPEFKQTAWLAPDNEHYDHDLLAVTKLRFLPWPQHTDTLYLVRDDEGNHLIPIGVSVYKVG